MIADGSYGNMSGTAVWTFGMSTAASTSPAGYKAYRCFKVAASGANSLRQNLGNLDASHKYYIGCYFKSSTTPNCTIKLQGTSSEGLLKLQNLIVFPYSTNDIWVKFSTIFEPVTTFAPIFRVDCYDNEVYLSRFIMVDLTDTFGAGNEPTKEWCDSNIREWDTYINFGSVATAVNTTNYETAWVANVSTQPVPTYGKYNYLQLDSNWEPRDYMYRWVLNTSTDNGSGIVSASKFAFINTETYYFYYDCHVPNANTTLMGRWTTFDFPLSHTISGNIVQNFVKNTEYNGGGGMKEWKRMSSYGTNTSLANDSYNAKYYLNNNKQTGELRATALCVAKVQSNINQYNAYNGTSITLANVNRAWCDRWIDGRSSPIIHIKDPNNKAIKFNTNYDIVCNDIEIRPELNGITMDRTGTIKCKKLVKTQNY